MASAIRVLVAIWAQSCVDLAIVQILPGLSLLSESMNFNWTVHLLFAYVLLLRCVQVCVHRFADINGHWRVCVSFDAALV